MKSFLIILSLFFEYLLMTKSQIYDLLSSDKIANSQNLIEELILDNRIMQSSGEIEICSAVGQPFSQSTFSNLSIGTPLTIRQVLTLILLKNDIYLLKTNCEQSFRLSINDSYLFNYILVEITISGHMDQSLIPLFTVRKTQQPFLYFDKRNQFNYYFDDYDTNGIHIK